MIEGEELVVETATRIISRYADPQAVNSLADDSWKVPLLDELHRAGILTAWASEAVGGGGGSLGLGFELAKTAGRYALGAPVVECLIAARVLSECGLPIPDGRLGIVPPSVRPLVLRDGALRGNVPSVPFVREVDVLVALAVDENGDRDGVGGRSVVVVVPVGVAGVVVEPGHTLAGDPSDRVHFDGAVPAATARAADGFADTVLGLGSLVRSLQIASALEGALDLTISWANQRVAFGKPIGKFQAIQHSIAVMACEVAAANTAATSAAAAVDEAGRIDLDDEGMYLEIAAAKVRSGESARTAARIAHQVHGAIGVTKEHVLHRFTLRALAWRDDFGDESHWALELGRRMLERGADDLWPLLASR